MNSSALWQQHFSELAQSADPEIKRLITHAHQVTLPPETTVFSKGSTCENYLLLAEGRVKVVLFTDSGREALLYRVLPGETCVLTTSCMLSHNRYNAEGITETQVSALLVSHQYFNRALDRSSAFRQFVFTDLGNRFADVIAHMERIKFTSIEQRLAEALLRHVDAKQQVHVTHQILANEIGSAREVVSRHLKRMENDGLLELHRGFSQLKDPQRLRALSLNGAAM